MITFNCILQTEEKVFFCLSFCFIYWTFFSSSFIFLLLIFFPVKLLRANYLMMIIILHNHNSAICRQTKFNQRQTKCYKEFFFLSLHHLHHLLHSSFCIQIISIICWLLSFLSPQTLSSSSWRWKNYLPHHNIAFPLSMVFICNKKEEDEDDDDDDDKQATFHCKSIKESNIYTINMTKVFCLFLSTLIVVNFTINYHICFSLNCIFNYIDFCTFFLWPSSIVEKASLSSSLSFFLLSKIKFIANNRRWIKILLFFFS